MAVMARLLESVDTSDGTLLAIHAFSIGSREADLSVIFD
jgi:hypothetical protein